MVATTLRLEAVVDLKSVPITNFAIREKVKTDKEFLATADGQEISRNKGR